MYHGVAKARGAVVTFEARGEILVEKGQVINGWTRRFRNRALRYTAEAAPSHNYAKRPLRPHPGTPLKKSFVAGKTKVHKRKMGGAIFTGLGSTAPYALFVDQGTNGQMAKILPPWSPNSPTLFEAAWRPKGGAPVGPKPVSGQRARNFFDAGMDRTFAYMLRRSYQVPGERGIMAPGGPSSSTMGWDTFFPGVREDPSFQGRLDEWRRWRQEAYGDPDYQATRVRRSRAMDPEAKAQRARDRAERRREESRKRIKEHRKKNKSEAAARAADEAAFIKAMKKRYGKIDVDSVEYRDGYWYALVWKDDGSGRHTWVEVRGKAKS